MASLVGRTVLITGGNGGIGLGMATAVGQAGAEVVIGGSAHDRGGRWITGSSVVNLGDPRGAEQ